MNKLFAFIFLFELLFSCCQNKQEKEALQNRIMSKYSNGQIETERIYDNIEFDKGTYDVFQYHEDGSLEMKGRVVRKLDQGKFEWFYPNGNWKWIETFEDGISVDTIFCYYESGKLKRRNLPPINMRRASVEYYETGETKITSFIYNGESLDSSWTAFYKNGKIKEFGLIDKGVRKGYWKYYDENGILMDSIDQTGKSKIVYGFEDEEMELNKNSADNSH